MFARHRRGAVSALFVALCAACGDDAVSTDIEAYFDATPPIEKTPEAFFAFPFPSDRLRVDGHVDFSMYPNPLAPTSISGAYALEASTLDGFSTSGGAYVRFTAPLDVTSLPTDPSAFLASDAALAIVDVTASSEEYGHRRPIRWQWWNEEDRGNYIAPNMLGFAPAWGFPLHESTTYAALVFRSLGGVNGEAVAQPELLRALLLEGASRPSTTPPIDAATFGTLHAQYAPLRAWLMEAGIDPATLASATVFTTQTITHDLAVIQAQIANDLPAPAMDDAGWQMIDTDATPYAFSESYEFRVGQTASYYVLEGRYAAPSYQEGTIPYENEGGALHFVNGAPSPVRQETIRFVLTVPTTQPLEGLDCYPVVMYGHGTGGSANSMRYDRTAGRLAGRGIAAISIDQPLHGIRDEGKTFDVELLSFNFFNPDAFRANFRQAAIDTFSLTRYVKESLRVPASVSPTGAQINFCPERVAFFGHSHGGLSGALAAPFEAAVDDWVLSGAGGGFGITLLERKDIIDFAVLVRNFMGVIKEEDFSELHPAITLLQTLADISDPANYAAGWNHRVLDRAPASVLLTSGQHDAATPYRTATVLATAAHLSPVNPIAVPAPEFGWIPLSPLDGPVHANANGETAAFLQWTNDIVGTNIDTHFVIFHRPEAIEAGNHFLETALYDFGGAAPLRVPTVVRDTSTNAR